jgi:hypothetical protein
VRSLGRWRTRLTEEVLMIDPPNVALMRRIFAWFNSLSSPDTPLQRSDVELFFTADARMITNGQLKCTGTEAFLQHFVEIRAKLLEFQVQPLQHSVADDSQVAAVYDIHYRLAPPDLKTGRIHACVLWSIEQGRVAKLNEWVYYEGETLSLDTIS